MEISNFTKEIMNPDLQTRTHFNELADSWESKQPKKNLKIEELLSRLDLKNAETILDIGCGTGVLFPFIKKLTAGKSNIFAVDFAECMVKTAASSCKGINVICGDVQGLSFKSNCFDCVIGFHVFPHVTAKRIALQECWRVLKPGGEMSIIHLRGSEELNDFHAEIGGAVTDHKMLSASEMSHFLADMEYIVTDAVDKSEEYFVRALKPNVL